MPLLHVAATQGTGCTSVLDARETPRTFPRNEAEYSAAHTLAARSGAVNRNSSAVAANGITGSDTAMLDRESSTNDALRRQEGIMTPRLTEVVPIEEPLAALERDLIASYVARTGQDLRDLRTRTDADARNLLVEASRYASTRLTEIEARFHYLHKLHGDASLCA